MRSHNGDSRALKGSTRQGTLGCFQASSIPHQPSIGIALLMPGGLARMSSSNKRPQYRHFPVPSSLQVKRQNSPAGSCR